MRSSAGSVDSLRLLALAALALQLLELQLLGLGIGHDGPCTRLPGILAPVPAYGVLVFPGGTEIGLELRRALAELKEVRLAGAGSEQDRHGPFAYRDWRTVLSVGEPGWIDGLNAVVDELEIDVIFPGHDDVLLALAEHAGEIRAGIVTSPVETCRITRSKRATYELLADVIPVPHVFAAPQDVGRIPRLRQARPLAGFAGRRAGARRGRADGRPGGWFRPRDGATCPGVS